MRRPGMALSIGLIMALVGLANVAAVGERATGTLVNGAGAEVGTVTLEQLADGVAIIGSARGLTPGQHGIHVHAVGTCTGPDFTSAGGHFNPATKKHGLKNPEGPHAGDVPNLTVAADGTTTFRATAGALTLTPGPASIFDADGAAVVIHAGPDDDVTDPAGNSGARIACAVLKLTQATPAMPHTGAGGALAADGFLAAGAVLLAIGAALGLARRRAA